MNVENNNSIFFINLLLKLIYKVDIKTIVGEII